MKLRKAYQALRLIEKEIIAVKLHSTPEIKELEAKLRFAKEQWAHSHIVPILNKLEDERQEIFRIIRMEKAYWEKIKVKPYVSTAIRQWFNAYKSGKYGSFSVRWVSDDEAWVIITQRKLRRKPVTRSFAIRVADNCSYAETSGKLTNVERQKLIARIDIYRKLYGN